MNKQTQLQSGIARKKQKKNLKPNKFLDYITSNS